MSPTKLRYDGVAKLLHWVMAAAIIALWAVGILMEDLPKGPLRSEVFGLHKAVGVVLLVLALARIGWRLAHPAPRLPATLSLGERSLAKIGHLGLYALMVAMPVDGILLSQSGGRAVSVFGLVLPTVVAKNEALKELFEAGHAVMAWVLVALVVGHVAAALRHHFLLGDQVLRRMLPARD